MSINSLYEMSAVGHLYEIVGRENILTLVNLENVF